MVANVEMELTWRTEAISSWHETHEEKLVSQIHRNPEGGYFYERERSLVLPFSHNLVVKVKWQTISSGGILVAPQPATLVRTTVMQILR